MDTGQKNPVNRDGKEEEVRIEMNNTGTPAQDGKASEVIVLVSKWLIFTLGWTIHSHTS